MTQRNVLIVFGAGASFDCAHEDHVPINRRWIPPLVCDLFSKDRPEFFGVAHQTGPEALALWAHLAPLAAQPGFNLEDELRRLAEHSDPTRRRLLLGGICYLRNVLRDSSDSFTRIAPAYSNLMGDVLSEMNGRATVITTNYDTILEKSVVGTYIEPITRFEDYCQSRVSIYKIHGSTNWYGCLGLHHAYWRQWFDDRPFRQVTDHVRQFMFYLPSYPDYVTPFLGVSATSLGDSLRKQLQYQENETITCLPILTAPMAGKSDSDLVLPPSLLQQLHRELPLAEELLVIGSSGLDVDLGSLLQRATNLRRWMIVAESRSSAEVTCDRLLTMAPALSRIECSLVGTGFARLSTSTDFKAWFGAGE